MRGTFSPHSSSSENGKDPELQLAIRGRAEEIYIRSGSVPGCDLRNWVQAEAEILQEHGASACRPAIIVDVQGMQYVGEYDSAFAHGYRPGEFAAGEDISVRIEGEKMFVRRPDGTELETTVVRKI